MNKQAVLRSINFGQRVAEEETDLLATYFVETDHWERLYRGDIDIIPEFPPRSASEAS